MSIELTIQLSNHTYQQILQQAQAKQQPPAEIAGNLLEQALTLLPTTPEDEAMLHAETTYKQLHPQLVQQYLGQNVAIYQGKLIDHDQNVVTLVRRVREQYPHEVIFIRKVEKEADAILHFRSPRLMPA